MEISVAASEMWSRVSRPGRRVVAASFVSSFLLMAAGAACSGAEGGLPDGPLGLVSDDATNVRVTNVERILRGDAPDDLADDVEDGWEDNLEEIGVSIDDLTSIVTAYGQDGRLIVLDGDIDFEQVRDDLDDNDYDDDEYKGYEMWEEGRVGFVDSAALLEERGQIVIGRVEAVRSVLKALNRGTGSLLEDDENDVLKALKMAGDGWSVTAGETTCGHFSEIRGCRAVGRAMSRGDEPYSVEITLAYLFRNERTAESQMDDMEDEIDDDLPREMDIEEVRVDGEFVIVTVVIDEDDWDQLVLP